MGDSESFVYGGCVSSSEATEQEIQDSGHFLLLREGQVKKFKVDKTIMEYNITLKQVENGTPNQSNPPAGPSQVNNPTN